DQPAGEGQQWPARPGRGQGRHGRQPGQHHALVGAGGAPGLARQPQRLLEPARQPAQQAPTAGGMGLAAWAGGAWAALNRAAMSGLVTTSVTSSPTASRTACVVASRTASRRPWPRPATVSFSRSISLARLLRAVPFVMVWLMVLSPWGLTGYP